LLCLIFLKQNLAQPPFALLFVALFCLCLITISASYAQERKLPADTTIVSTDEVTIKGQKVPYRVTTGTQSVYGDDGKVDAALYYTYYKRTDVVNGGSVFVFHGYNFSSCSKFRSSTESNGEGPYERLIIRGANMIDGTGAPMSGPVDIVIEGNKIASVHRVGYPGVLINEARRPKGATKRAGCCRYVYNARFC